MSLCLHDRLVQQKLSEVEIPFFTASKEPTGTVSFKGEVGWVQRGQEAKEVAMVYQVGLVLVVVVGATQSGK